MFCIVNMLYRISVYLDRCGKTSKVMDHECKIAFLHWFAYLRATVPDKDYLSCPLSGCRRSDFKDFASCLQHVSTCSFLPDAKYWCPYCEHDEPFDMGKRQHQRLSKGHKQTRESRLKKAITSFFIQFGRRSPPEHLADHCYKPELDSQTHFGRKSRPEHLADHCYKPELDSQNRSTHEICTMVRGSYFSPAGHPTSCHPQSELCGAINGPGIELGTEWYQQFELLGDTGIELSGTRSYIHNLECLDIVDFTGDLPAPVRQLSVTSDGSHGWANEAQGSLHSALVSPEPFADHRFRSQSYYPRRDSGASASDITYTDSEPSFDKKPRVNDWCVTKHSSLPFKVDSVLPAKGSKPGSMGSKPHHESIGLRLEIPSSLSGHLQKEPLPTEAVPQPTTLTRYDLSAYRIQSIGGNKQRFLEDFRQIVLVLEGLWAQQLNSCPELASLTAQLCCPSPLRRGLEVLRQFFSPGHKIPRTATETYHFIHIAFACAYLAYAEDDRDFWEIFYHDVLRWGQGISDPQDRRLYIQVAEFLWSSPPGTVIRPVSVCLSQESDRRVPAMDLARTFSIEETGLQDVVLETIEASVPFNEAYDDLALLGQLRNGYVIKGCTRYLDGNQPIPPATRTKLIHYQRFFASISTKEKRISHP